MSKNKKSQVSDIIAHLRKYKKITSLEAIKLYGSTRLSGVIFQLKKRGFVISTEIAFIKNRYGNLTHYAIYHLEKDVEEVDDL